MATMQADASSKVRVSVSIDADLAEAVDAVVLAEIEQARTHRASNVSEVVNRILRAHFDGQESDNGTTTTDE